MYKRPHHQRILKLLNDLNGDFLESAGCWFAGGTAIVLQLGEYRESLDIDFICSTREGFRALRNTVTPESLGEVSKGRLTLAREVVSDQYGIRTRVLVDDVPIKFEIIQESRIDVIGAPSTKFGVPLIASWDAQAEKLLANADRGADRSTHFRDMIDLAFTIDAWGWPGESTWQKVGLAYGEHVVRSFEIARARLCDGVTLREALKALGISLNYEEKLMAALGCGQQSKPAGAASPCLEDGNDFSPV